MEESSEDTLRVLRRSFLLPESQWQIPGTLQLGILSMAPFLPLLSRADPRKASERRHIRTPLLGMG